MFALIDLSAAFDTIHHDNLFCILEKYVGICGNGLKLIKSYIFLIVLNMFKLIMFCSYYLWCSPEIVLGPLKLCFYLLPMSTILKYHKISYQKTDLTKLWRTIKGIDGRAKREAANEAITFN